MWYRLVGSAVEHAVASYKEVNPQDDRAAVVDFGELFLKQKTSEEEGTSLGEMLDELDTVMRDYFKAPHVPAKAAGLYDGEFIAKELAACLNEIVPLMGVETIRGFLFQKIPMSAKLSPRTVGMALAAYVDKWRVVGAEKLVLRVRPLNKANVYHVHREPV